MNRGTTGVNSLPKTVTRQRRDCDLNPGPSAPESSTLTTRLPSHPRLARRTQPNTASFVEKSEVRTMKKSGGHLPGGEKMTRLRMGRAAAPGHLSGRGADKTRRHVSAASSHRRYRSLTAQQVPASSCRAMQHTIPPRPQRKKR